MPQGKARKSNNEFFSRTITFCIDNGKDLKKICPECTDQYNDHSLLKLLCINYWVAFFARIVHKQLKAKYGYKVAFVDAMAGSGVTTTKRAGDFLCGSSPGAVKSADDINCPFDLVIVNELNKEKSDALEKRLRKISSAEIVVLNENIQDVSERISRLIDSKTVSFIVIDPQALQGMTWSALKPLLSCKGDVMITWFEREAWRVLKAAESKDIRGKAAGQARRLTELFGDERWRDANSAKELTELFITKVFSDCGKSVCEKVRIPRPSSNYYYLMLFTDGFKNAEKLAKEWKRRVQERIDSVSGADISSLLDIKDGRIKPLDDFF